MGQYIKPAESLGALLFHVSWQAALLAVVVALICKVAGKQITFRWQFILWGVVFVRLACPVLPSSIFSAANIRFTGEADLGPRPASPHNTPVTERVTQLTHAETYAQVIQNDEVAPVPREEPAKEPVALMPPVTEAVEAKVKIGKVGEAAAAPVELVWPTVFSVWIVVTGVLLARFLWRHRQLRRLARSWRQANDPEVLELLEGCRRKLGIRRVVRLVLSDRPIGPATFGVVRPRIVLPEPLLQSLTSRDLQMVLLHELTHVRRVDILWDHLAFVIAAVHWFNPAAWWALCRLRSARELAADAALLSSLEPKEVKSYGHLIVNLAARQIVPRSQAVLVGAIGNSRLLHRRIEMIANYRKPSWKQTLLGATVLGTLALCGLTSAQNPQASDEDSAKAVSQEAQGTSAKEPQPSTADEYIVSGTCTDEDKRPLDDVRVRLFRVDDLKNKRELVQEIQTAADGKFHFGNLPAPRSRESTGSKSGIYFDTYYVLAATKSGRTSRLDAFFSSKERTQEMSISMPKAGTLSGRVTDDAGRPVKGAEVFIDAYPSTMRIEGISSDTSDADGRFSIPDLMIFDVDKAKPQKVGKNTFEVAAGCYFTVLHPDFGMERPLYTKIPSTVDVVLKPGATIEGQVLDRTNGKPSAKALVSMQGIGSTNAWRQVTTDENGKYHLTSVAAGQYNIWADAKARTCIAIDSLKVEAGKTYSDQDISLVEGGWLEGRIVDARTGEPISEADGRGLRVASYGPARPKSGAAVVSAPVDKDGRFGLRVGPGKNFPYIMTSEIWKRTEDVEKFREGIDVGEGELVVLDFKVLSEVPHKKVAFSPVRLSIPVAEEREAAAAIRLLGGWYALDEAKYVVEVNMIYHNTQDGVRHSNDQKDTEEALKWLPKFSRLKRLYLTEGQASDEGMRHVAELSELEVLLVWGSQRLTDVGVQHLTSLKKLKDIQITNSRISDGALQVFGGFGHLERLSLQGNYFTDLGIRHLSHLSKLKVLWIGAPEARLTEQIAPHLARLKNLEELELQQIPFTDEGIKQLKPLTKLRKLYLHGAADEERTITDASAEVLLDLTGIQFLHIQHCRMSDETVKKLAALPNLNLLSLEGTNVRQETEAELKKKYPNASIDVPFKKR